MNVRIQELLLKATNPDYDSDDGPMNELNVEKFARLIVQECVNVLHDNELWSRHISHALNEHFGVEL